MKIVSKEGFRKLADPIPKEDSFNVDVEFKGNKFFSNETFITSLCSSVKFGEHRAWKKNSGIKRNGEPTTNGK